MANSSTIDHRSEGRKDWQAARSKPWAEVRVSEFRSGTTSRAQLIELLVLEGPGDPAIPRVLPTQHANASGV